MTQDQQKQAEAEAHQQGHPDGDGTDCLHCALHDTVIRWITRMNAAGGAPVEATGYQLGQFMCEALNNFRATLSPEDAQTFVDYYNQGQVNAGMVLAAQQEEPAGTKH